MSLNWAALAIPAFFIFLGLEAVVARKGKKNLFDFNSSIANISVGILERLMNLFISASFISVFYYIYEQYRVFDIPLNIYVWIILLLMTDLVWYWYHRLSHEINIFWAAHIVHHQSEEYNYTVSARITVFQALLRNVFWSVLPFLGFHPVMVVAILIVHGTYSFFTHTQVIGKLGWIEKIMITPSHHRVHHASDEKYLNKNYGDIFVFWDKLFGTFQREEEKPSYGLTHPLKSYSFLWQHFHYFMELLEGVKRKKTFREKLAIVFGKPEMLDQNIRPTLEKRFLSSRVVATSAFRVYVVAQIVICLVTLFFLVLFSEQTVLADNIFVATFIVITLINCGALLEQRQWIYYLEYLRLFVLLCLIDYHFESIELMTMGIIFILFSASSETVRKYYFRFVYAVEE